MYKSESHQTFAVHIGVHSRSSAVKTQNREWTLINANSESKHAHADVPLRFRSVQSVSFVV